MKLNRVFPFVMLVILLSSMLAGCGSAATPEVSNPAGANTAPTEQNTTRG